MPPRVVKRGGRSGGKKTPASGRAKAAAEEAVAVEETVTVSTVIETKEEIEIEEEEPSIEEIDYNGYVNDQEDVKESYEEDRSERLELEDNELEYEAEEETAIDYDEQDMDHADDEVFDGDEAEEYGEPQDIVEEEGVMLSGEEMEDGGVGALGHEVDGEEEEHHEVVKQHRKRKEFEVFVGGLDKDATENDLRNVFSAVGEITEVRLMMNPLTRKNKGFAFLRFATAEQAKRAVSELRAPMVNGKQCGVAPSQDSDTLFLGNICKTWTKEHLNEELKSLGIDNVEDLTLVEDTNNEGKNRGFAFLEFSSRSDAMEASRRLQRRDIFLGTERNPKVSFADSFNEPDDEIMAQVTTVFVDGLPAAWDEDRVKEYLKKYGLIEKIELARNMPAAKRKDFGFITFDTHDNAVACAEGINNRELGEGDNKVKIRARLSRPRQKIRGKHGIHGEIRIDRGAPKGGHISYSRPPPARRFPEWGTRRISSRGAPIFGYGAALGSRVKYPVTYRENRAFDAVTERPRRVAPSDRFYNRRPPVPFYPKSYSKREYSGRGNVPPSRSRALAEYAYRVPTERRPADRERRAYAQEGYGRKFERPPPNYREGRSHDYDSVSGSKRPYSELDDVSHRYADVSVRQSRARLEYVVSGSSDQYSNAYGDSRTGRSYMGYGRSRGSLSRQEGMYSGRQGMSYGGGLVSDSDIDGMYTSGYRSSYPPRGSDLGGNSYSSMYSGRSLSGSGYLNGGGSDSYY